MKKVYVFILGIIVCTIPFISNGQISLTTSNGSYSENFDGMGASGTTYPTGWTGIKYDGNNPLNGTLTPSVTNGSSNSGTIYNVGTTNATERALGTLASGSTVPAFGVSFTNNTSSVITDFSISGFSEQWRTGSSNTVNETVIFEYSTDATSLYSGTWAPISNLNLIEILTTSTSAGAVDGNDPANRVAISGNISSVNLAVTGTIWIRWRDADVSGSDGLYALDDFQLSYTNVPVGNSISIAAGSDAAESPTPTAGNFTISFNPATSGITTVDYDYTGTAGFGTDYTVSYSAGTPSASTSTGTLTIPTGISSITVTITPVDDATSEGTETVIVGLSNPSAGYSIGTGSATINITDDDQIPTVSVTANTNATEPATNGSFTVTLSETAPVGGITVTYTLAGTAMIGSDYTDPQSGSMTIPEGSNSGTLTMNIVDDALPETDETIEITLTGATTPYVINTGTATISVISDDITPISLTGGAYTQNFNTLPSSGTGTLFDIIPTGWGFTETGASANTIFTTSTGSSNTGDTYSFGASSNSERAFGTLLTGNLSPVIGAGFTNNTGTVITTLRIIYTGEQWRLGATGRNDMLNFEYSTNANGLSNGTWTGVSQLDFVSPISTGSTGALDGNATANQTDLSFIITGISIPDGAAFFIRWVDVNVSGSDDGLGIDNFSIEPNYVDVNAPVVISLDPVNGATSVATSFTASLAFNENIQKGTGNILIRKTSDNSVAQTIDVTSASVIVSGTTITFNVSSLAPATAYYIEIASGAIKDIANNDFAGITGNSVWSFATGTQIYYANFNTCTTGSPGTVSNGFTQYSITGPQVWDCTTFGNTGNGIQINGFSGTNIPNEDWLISPTFDLTTTSFPLLSFWSRTRFNGLPLQLKVSTDYVSGDPSLAIWTDINGKFPAQTTDVWTLSDNINLSAFKSSTTTFAFVYYSSEEDGARWTIDDVVVDNSAAAPPPSLTINTGDIQFGYAASGNNVDKTLIVTGNDITGDINLVATSGFTLADNPTGPFNSSLTLTQAASNNITRTVYVRFSPAQNNQNFTGTVTISTPSVTDDVINLKGTSVDPVNTLEVVNWNIEWFGSPSLGPTDDAQQQANIQTILQNIGADLYGLLEVVDESRLATVVSNMPGYSYVICDYGSHTNTSESGPTPLSEAQKEAFVYKTSVFSNITTTPLLTQGINSAADLTNPAYNYFASGRFPYMMTADVTLNGVTKTIRFILIHAKANTSPTVTSYNRRKAGADTLHFTLNNLYPNDNIIILGDFNDDLDQTITDGINPPVTSYSAFVDDNTNFSKPTLALSLAGKKSTVSYNDMIDHVVLSNEIAGYYMNSTASVLDDVTSLVTNYGSTTTDHYPVFMRYAFDPVILPVRLISFSAVKQNSTAKISWKTAEEINLSSFVVERSVNGSNWEVLATVPATGSSNTQTEYTIYDQAPVKGLNLYRLKSIDIDSRFDYSAIRRVDFSNRHTVSIYPNPVKDQLWINVDNAGGFNGIVQVFNQHGQVLINKQFNTENQQVELSLNTLSPGLYFLKIIEKEGEVSLQKFVKQ